jgi:hypothetical protein
MILYRMDRNKTVHSESQHKEVSAEHHNLAALHTDKETPEPNGQYTGWIWWQRENLARHK